MSVQTKRIDFPPESETNASDVTFSEWLAEAKPSILNPDIFRVLIRAWRAGERADDYAKLTVRS